MGFINLPPVKTPMYPDAATIATQSIPTLKVDDKDMALNWALFFQQQAAAIANLGSPFGLNLVFSGDSRTAGYYGSLTDPYPMKVGTRLGISQTVITNLGVAGAQTSGVIATQLPEAQAAYNTNAGITNWFILWIGVNDFLQGVPLSTTEANIHQIIGTAQGYGYTTLLLTETPQNFAGSPAGYEAWRALLRTWIVGGSSGSTYYLNTGDMNVLSNTTNVTWYSDQLHLTDLGYLLIASAVASFLLSSLGGFIDLLPPQKYPGGAPLNTNFTEYDINVESYGMLAGPVGTGNATQNGDAWERAYTAAAAAGVGLYFPGPMYISRKVNLYSTTGVPVRMYSKCGTTASGATAAPGTRIICDGTGVSWLKGAINFAIPNGSNTGPSTTAQTFGNSVFGIFADVASGVTGIMGFWLVRQYEFRVDTCGVYTNGAAAWTAGIQLDTCVLGTINNFYASFASTGIALGGPTSTGPTAGVRVIDCVIGNSCIVGLGTAYAEFCTIEGGSIQSCSTAGIVGAGPNNDVIKVLFGTGGSTNAIDYTELASSVPPFGGPNWVNDYKTISRCVFNSPVQLKGCTGTVIIDNYCNSSLSIDSGCSATIVNQQLKFFTSFTDSSTSTYYAGPPVMAVGVPTGAQGIRTQIYFDITTVTAPVQWIVTASGTPATWAKVFTGSGGGGIVTVNPGGNTGPAITFTSGAAISVTNPTGNTIQITNTGVTSIVAGSGISISGATGAVTITNSAGVPPAWTSYSPVVTVLGGGSALISGFSFRYSQQGKNVLFSVLLNMTWSGGTVTGVTFSLPGGLSIASAGGGAAAWGNGSVGFSNFLTFQPASTVIQISLIGATVTSGIIGITASFPLEST